MLTQPILDQLSELRLYALAQAWQAQHADSGIEELAFDERMALLIEAEWMDPRCASSARGAGSRRTRTW
jgi:hypothetical protein